MKIKTSELTGPALDWAVAKCGGLEVYVPAFAEKPWLQYRDCYGQPHMCPKYSTDWAFTGPIIEREFIQLADPCTNAGYEWRAWCGGWNLCGPTALIAICRCYVASLLGDEVDVPEELLCPSPITNSAS